MAAESVRFSFKVTMGRLMSGGDEIQGKTAGCGIKGSANTGTPHSMKHEYCRRAVDDCNPIVTSGMLFLHV